MSCLGHIIKLVTVVACFPSKPAPTVEELNSWQFQTLRHHNNDRTQPIEKHDDFFTGSAEKIIDWHEIFAAFEAFFVIPFLWFEIEHYPHDPVAFTMMRLVKKQEVNSLCVVTRPRVPERRTFDSKRPGTKNGDFPKRHKGQKVKNRPVGIELAIASATRRWLWQGNPCAVSNTNFLRKMTM